MERAKLLRLGGYAAGVVLILFGIGTIAIGIAGKSTVEDELSQEKIVGSPDMSPEGIAPGIEEAKLTVDAPGLRCRGGADRHGFRGALLRAVHADPRARVLRRDTYAEMGRFVSADDPTTRPAPTTRPPRRRMRAESRSRTPPAIPG